MAYIDIPGEDTMGMSPMGTSSGCDSGSSFYREFHLGALSHLISFREAVITVDSLTCRLYDASESEDMYVYLRVSSGPVGGSTTEFHSPTSFETTGADGISTVTLLEDFPLDPGRIYTLRGLLNPVGDECGAEIALVDCQIEYTVGDQLLEIDAGWNIVSLNHQPESMDLWDVFEGATEEVEVISDTTGESEMVSNLRIMKNNAGAALLPDWGFNGIGDIEIGQGYQAKVLEDVTLQIGGDIVPSDTDISIMPGWNLIGYLPLGRLSPWEAFESLALDGELNHLFAKDENGAVFWPELGYSGITEMEPSEGYQLRNALIIEQTLSYPVVAEWEND
jgi:hypothetical protein